MDRHALSADANILVQLSPSKQPLEPGYGTNGMTRKSINPARISGSSESRRRASSALSNSLAYWTIVLMTLFRNCSRSD